jgi:DNA-binding transcriptional regulator YhcF (GntR family)
VEAFKRLEHEKLITRIQKSGVFIGTGNKKEMAPYKVEPFKTRAEEIADSIISGISRGDIKSGNHLTLNKVLSFKYAAAKRTIKKAIDILLNEKYIHKDGLSFRIGQPIGSTFRTKKNRIYILTKPGFAGWNFTRAYDKSFELELHKHGVNSFEYLNLWNEPDF